MVTGDTTLKETIRTMREARSGCVLIGTPGNQTPLDGIFTERDIVTRVIGKGLPEDTPVSSVMTPDPLTVSSMTSLGDAIALLIKHGFRNVPVTDETSGTVIGTLTTGNIVHFISEHFHTEIFTLPPDLHQTFDRRSGG